MRGSMVRPVILLQHSLCKSLAQAVDPRVREDDKVVVVAGLTNLAPYVSLGILYGNIAWITGLTSRSSEMLS